MPPKTKTGKSVLTAAYAALALHIQEAAAGMSDQDKRSRLSNALREIFRGSDEWVYLIDVFGDDKSGDLIYSGGSFGLKKAPYTIAESKVTIDTAAAVNVYPLTTYHEENVSTVEAGRRNSASDLKQIQSIHDASSMLGAECMAKEAHKPKPAATTGSIQLMEGVATLEPIVLKEARADYEIKLIAPGKGSSAVYPKEVLQRDGPKVFTKSTHVYMNHPTAMEEATRPEGNVYNLAGVLTTDAVYHESHPKGEGLYARMKVFADHADLVEDKAPHVGMSIRASGVAEAGVKRDGLPVLKELLSAESVDVVTRAGAGGMILTEAAVPPNSTEGGATDMDAAELKKLQEGLAAAQVVNKQLLERALRGDAREEAARILKGVTLIEAAKERVIESVLRGAIPQTEAGALDTVKFKETVEAAAKAEGAYVASLIGSGQVRGLGVVQPQAVDPKEAAAKAQQAADDRKALRESAIKTYIDLGLPKAAAEAAADRSIGEAA